MSQPLALDENKFDKIVKLEDIINTPIDNNFGYFVEVDSSYPENFKKKTKTFHLLL